MVGVTYVLELCTSYIHFTIKQNIISIWYYSVYKLLFFIVPGDWSEWGLWSECSTTCDEGVQDRHRVCNIPLFGGLPCVGDRDEVVKCSVQPCYSKSYDYAKFQKKYLLQTMSTLCKLS